MPRRKVDTMQDEYIEKMIRHLPVLRASIGLTQEQLGVKLGVSRQTVVAIENGRSPLTWSLYLAIVCVFEQYKESKIILTNFDIFKSEYVRNDL